MFSSELRSDVLVISALLYGLASLINAENTMDRKTLALGDQLVP